MQILFTEEARDETVTASRWYDDQRPGLGEVFRSHVNATLNAIAWQPLALPVVHRDLRRAVVTRFPYTIYYRASETAIIVVGVIHGRRHPRLARGR